MSNSLQPHGLYNPWNSPGKNTGVGSLSLLRGSWTHFPHCRHILHQLSHKGSPRISLIESNNFLSPSSPFTLLSCIDHVSSAPTMVFWTTCTLHLLTVFRKKKYIWPVSAYISAFLQYFFICPFKLCMQRWKTLKQHKCF